MFDLQRIGGISGWVDAASLGARQAVPLSSHLFPEVSAHLLAVSTNRDRLEVVDWANPILCEPMRIHDGTMTASDRPGTGVSWDEDAVKRFSSAS